MEVYKRPYYANFPFEQAVEWIYSQKDAHASSSLMIVQNDMMSNAIQYYITHDGKRPSINVMSSHMFGSEGDTSWKRIYRFDGHSAPPQIAMDILQQYYDLIIENRDYNVFVYQNFDSNCFYYPEELYTDVGERRDNSLVTTESKGALAYGPYHPLKAGEYRWTIKGQIFSIDQAYADVVSRNEANVFREHARFKFKIPSPNNDIILQETFILHEQVQNLEARIWVGEKDNLRFDCYIIERFENNVIK